MGKDKTRRVLRRLAALLLCAALCPGLGGCGRKKDAYAVKLREGLRFTVATAMQPDSLIARIREMYPTPNRNPQAITIPYK